MVFARFASKVARGWPQTDFQCSNTVSATVATLGATVLGTERLCESVPSWIGSDRIGSDGILEHCLADATGNA